MRLFSSAAPVAVTFFCGSILLCGSSTGWSQQYNIHFASAGTAGDLGGPITIPINLENSPSAVTGFSFGMRYDTASLTFEALDIGASLSAALRGLSPDDRFYHVNTAPAGGSGITVAMILSANDASVVLPLGINHIFDARFRISIAATSESRVTLAGDLGSPPVPILLDLNGRAQPPAGAPKQTSFAITIAGGAAPFIRGDVNQSGRLDVTDGILLLDYLFQGSVLEPGAPTRQFCVQAMNVDGTVDLGEVGVEDEPDIDLSDAIYLLDYVFRRGIAPPSPFPACGAAATLATPTARCSLFTCR